MSWSAITEGEDAMLVLDRAGRVRSATSRAAALLGCAAGELVGRVWADVSRPADVAATVREHTLQGAGRRTKLRLVTLDAAAASGAHGHWLSPWSDSAELALLRGPDGRVLAVNSAFARKFGPAAGSWPGRDPGELIHPDDVDDWRRSVEQLSRAPFQASHEHRWMTAQGWRWIAWEEQAVRTDSGSIMATRAIGRDVTRRRLAEEHFHKLANIVEQTQLSVVLTMPDGRVEYVNPRFTQVSGFTLEEIFEQDIKVLRTGFTNDVDYASFLRTVRAGKTWSGEIQTISKRGEARWESAQVSVIHDNRDRVTHLLCLREDITERKMLEAQLRQAQKMEVLGMLAGGISHDFNNLLAIMSGFCELAMGRTTQDEKTGSYLREIHGATQRASALVRQILSFSRKPEDGVRQVGLSQLVEDVVRMLRATFPRDIEFVVDAPLSLPAVRADSNQLQQVVMNLCVNARDAMPEGGTLAVRTRLRAGSEIALPEADAHGRYVTIEVADTGGGMPPEVKARIFEPFFTTKGKDLGTGLGLAVVRNIVSSHGGLIEVRSEPGEGTTFLVHLPLLEQGGPAAVGVLEANSPSGIPRGSESVLVVEDEPGVRTVLCATLESGGYRVFSAADGAEAVEFLLGRTERVDAVILDLNLPRLSGLQVREYLRHARHSPRLLIVSGHVPPALRQDIEQAGDAVIVGKPFSLSTIGEVLRKLLDKPAASLMCADGPKVLEPL